MDNVCSGRSLWSLTAHGSQTKYDALQSSHFTTVEHVCSHSRHTVDGGGAQTSNAGCIKAGRSSSHCAIWAAFAIWYFDVCSLGHAASWSITSCTSVIGTAGEATSAAATYGVGPFSTLLNGKVTILPSALKRFTVKRVPPKEFLDRCITLHKHQHQFIVNPSADNTKHIYIRGNGGMHPPPAQNYLKLTRQ